MPTLDPALLCSSSAGSDLGCESGLIYKDLQVLSLSGSHLENPFIKHSSCAKPYQPSIHNKGHLMLAN